MQCEPIYIKFQFQIFVIINEYIELFKELINKDKMKEPLVETAFDLLIKSE
jgi:hypothetical protein